jgi:hypothetical protein
MPEGMLKLYLDQMLRMDVARILRIEAMMLSVPAKSDKPEQMTMRYYRRRLTKIEFLLHWMNILATGLSCRLADIQA